MGKTSIWPLVWLNIRKWKNNYRVWIVFLIEFSYMQISTYEYKLQAVANHLAQIIHGNAVKVAESHIVTIF